MLKLNIQLFAEEKPETAPTAQETQAQDPKPDDDLPKTQEELDALIEARVARERKKFAKQITGQPAAVAQPAAQPTTQQQGTTTPEYGAAQPAAQSANAVAEAQRELLSARAQLEALRSGVRADVAEDAVLLALHEVERDGDDPDEDTVREALKAVLKRHPDWKQEIKKQGGIKVGAQQQESTGAEPGKPVYSGVTFF